MLVELFYGRCPNRYSRSHLRMLILIVFCCQNLEYDVHEREPHYTMLLTKGDNVIQTGHPAPGPIEVRLA